jgi:hypothetical protein
MIPDAGAAPKSDPARQRLKRLLVLVVLVVALVSPPSSEAGEALDAVLQTHCGGGICTIRDNAGGDIGAFQRAAREIVAEGKHLVIDGFCASACVVMADLARANTCITAKAEIAVHKTSLIEVPPNIVVSARDVPEGRFIRRVDPPQAADIDRWVRAHGGYPVDGFMVIPVQDARKFWPMCR